MSSKYELLSEFTTMSVPAMDYWLGKFVPEKMARNIVRIACTSCAVYC